MSQGRLPEGRERRKTKNGTLSFWESQVHKYERTAGQTFTTHCLFLLTLLGKEDECEAERGCLFKSDQQQKKPYQSSSEQKKLDRVNSAKSMGEINSDMVKHKSTEEELRPQEFAVQKENISLETENIICLILARRSNYYRKYPNLSTVI